jgi:4-aminobutyrate aminotransferase/(S)-3-amino-2-methylpropionate transaminase
VRSPKEYFGILKKICQDNGIVFIADEIQTGFGRTARMFAMEHYDVAPDLTTMAKSIAGGLPLSAITGKADLMDHPQVGGLGGTFAGNPVSCRAALADRYPVIGDVRGLGAMVGMELVVDRRTKEPAAAHTKRLIDLCRERGLLMISAGTHSNIIRSLMPLVITDEQLERGLAIIEDGLHNLHVDK